MFLKTYFQNTSSNSWSIGVDPNNGVGDVYSKIENLADSEREAIEVDLLRCYEKSPGDGDGRLRQRDN